MRRFSKLRGAVSASLALGILAAPLASASPGFTADPETLTEGKSVSIADGFTADPEVLTSGKSASTPDGPTKPQDAFDRATAAAPSAMAACRLETWPPSQDYATNWVGVQGGRFDCLNYATFTLELRKARPFFPDAHLATAYGSGNQAIRAFAACDGRGDYFGKVISSTGTIQEGPRVGLC